MNFCSHFLKVIVLVFLACAFFLALGKSEPSKSENIEVYFTKVSGTQLENKSNPNSIANHCINFIRSAKSTIDIAGFEIDNELIIKEIIDAHKRSIKIRVLTDSDYAKEIGPTSFLKSGIEVHFDKRSSFMHNKFIVVDKLKTWTGSFNFTELCAYRNHNDAIVLTNHKVAANYTDWFQWRISGGRDSRRSKKRTIYPTILIDNHEVKTLFTPFDDLENAVISYIRKANNCIRVAMFSFTNKKIADELVIKSKSVDVQVVLEGNGHNRDVGERLKANGIKVTYESSPKNLHFKFMVVDDVVLTGSYNWSKNAESSNDENLVIISGIADVYINKFNNY